MPYTAIISCIDKYWLIAELAFLNIDFLICPIFSQMTNFAAETIAVNLENLVCRTEKKCTNKTHDSWKLLFTCFSYDEIRRIQLGVKKKQVKGYNDESVRCI